ncbi:MAG: ATP synthase F0 subunit B [Deltaproteobacteria bacterium]|jgi:F-type H+-transporting ATPase subunit b|nr:ATP synthase F0 subunit B [Deltaproteobacteria bacterium]
MRKIQLPQFSWVFILISFLSFLAFCPWAFASETSGGYTSAQWKEFGLRVMNFAVFFAILFFLLRKPVKNFFKGRKEDIARTLEYLETQAKNLEEQNRVTQRKLSELEGERERVIAQFERDGARERDRIIAEAQKTAEAIIHKTEIAMEQELNLARRKLINETGVLAAKIAEELLIKNITDEDKFRLTHEFVSEVTKLPVRK